jgi:hypothetical protein
MSQSQYGHVGEKKGLFTMPRIESYFSAFQVAVHLLYQPDLEIIICTTRFNTNKAYNVCIT